MKVLVGGFPNSGTSFLCNLVAEMGYSPGSEKNLKGADEHNRFGYWEHLPLRDLVWGTAGFNANQHAGHLPRKPLELRGHPNRLKIEHLAREDGVEVYKDVILPLIYTLFPSDAKYITITRDPEAIYRSGHYKVGKAAVFKGICQHYELTHQMAANVTHLYVCYDDVREDPHKQITRIAQFLGQPTVGLERVWRPRR